jgi:hypothetical protein
MTEKSKPNGGAGCNLQDLYVFSAAFSQAADRSLTMLETRFEEWTKGSQHF